MSGRLTGKVVLLTGAAGGQGRVAAELFAAEGASVVATDIETEPSDLAAKAFASAGARYMAADLTDESAVDRVVLEVLDVHGRLDVLYCNHAITQEVEPLLDTALAKFDRLFDINVRSAFLVNRAAGRAIAESGGGSIINISSVAALVGNAGLAPYSMTKIALLHMSRILAVELAEQHVRVNVICPGLIDTPMAYAPVAHLPPAERDRLFKQVHEAAPMKRIGRPEEVVQLAIHLASDESSYTTGAVISVDGGVAAR